MKDVDFLSELFSRLKDNNIDYAVMRKAEDIITGIFNDIDWVICNDKKKEFNAILDNVCQSLNWKIEMRIQKDGFEAIRLHSVGDDTPILLHFDLFETFSWKGNILFSNRELLSDVYEKNSTYSVSITTEAMIQFLTRFLFNGYVKKEYRENIQKIWKEYPEAIEKKMTDIFGTKYASILNDQIINNKWDDIENSVKAYRKEAEKVSRKKSFIRYISAKARFKLYNFHRLFGNHGLMMVFEGTDGSGKTTIIEALPKVLYRSYDESYIDYYHWRPGFIKKTGNSVNSNPITEPHAKRPYNKFVSFGKLAFFNLDYIFGYLFKVKIQLAKGRLDIFDRYYYDYYIDKIRYRLDVSDKLLDFFKIFIPKPDVTFLLMGDPAVLYNRKKEISVDEIRKQLQIMESYKNKFKNPVVIDVDKTIDCVVGSVSNVILDELVKKTEGKN